MDCLEGMKLIPDKSIDMILCDLPYGTTACKWDTIIPFELLWKQYERIIKDNGAIVLTASQPFTSALVMSNPKIFKYDITYEKAHAKGFLNAKKMPLRAHEDILVFYKKLPTYNPQKSIVPEEKRDKRKKYNTYSTNDGGVYNDSKGMEVRVKKDDGTRYPRSVIQFNNKKEVGYHPTQKPVALFEYLIKTYTNEGDLVLDNCMGSGTTAVAALENNRKFIGFETEPKYIEVANKRIESL
ncbi:DNA-methyltransferase [Paenibacillus taichungensis]|uniref:DNA-methyltransferase n=1 Tax=Paenibacillus taichungensis TaxID=484184 RepID=UPI0039A25C71